MDQIRRILLLAHIPLLIIWFSLAAGVYGGLPESIPTHFDATGTPDAFMKRSYTSWFLLPVIGLVSALLIVVSTAVSERFPKFMNVPNKAAFLALSDEQRKPLTSMMGAFLATMSLTVVAFLAVLHFDTWRVAHGYASGLSWLSMTAFVLLMVFAVGGSILFSVRFGKLVSKIAEDAKRVHQQ